LNKVQVGNWQFEIKAQPSFPYFESLMMAPISMNGQTVTFTAGNSKVSLTPISVEAYTSTGGNIFTYNILYDQPNPLKIPAGLALPALPLNWTSNLAGSPTTIGSNSTNQASLTIWNSSCVDQQFSLAVTTMDSQGTIRAISAPQTISKLFNSSVTVIYTGTGSSVGTCSGGSVYTGTLSFGLKNSCIASLRISWGDNGGSNCGCENLQVKDQSGAVVGNDIPESCINHGINVGPGVYNLVFTKGGGGGSPTLNLGISAPVTFINNNFNVPTSASVTAAIFNY
jgi:hypothetical protein